MKAFLIGLIALGASFLGPAAHAQSPMQPPPYGDFPAHIGADANNPEGPFHRNDPESLRESRVPK